MSKPQKVSSDHPANADTGKPANIDKGDTNMSEDQDAVFYEHGGAAKAYGEDTHTAFESTATIVDHGPVTTAKINRKATAVAEGDSTCSIE